jgi:hypothetical protein
MIARTSSSSHSVKAPTAVSSVLTSSPTRTERAAMTPSKGATISVKERLSSACTRATRACSIVVWPAFSSWIAASSASLAAWKSR